MQLIFSRFWSLILIIMPITMGLKENEKKAFSIYWSIVLIIIPFFFFAVPGQSLRHSKDVFFLAASFASLFLFNRPKLTKPYKPLLIILLLSFFNQHNRLSNTVFIQWVFLSVSLIVLMQMSQYLKKEYALRAFRIVCITQTIWILFEYFGLHPFGVIANFSDSYKTNEFVKGVTVFNILDMRFLWAQYDVGVVTGSLNNLTLSGALIAITIPSLFIRRWWVLCPIPCYAIMLTESTMSIASMITGVCIYFIYSYKSKLKYLVLAVPLFIVSIFYVLRPDHHFFNSSGRIEAWSRIFNFINGWDIIIGKGLGYLSDTYRFSFETSHLRPIFTHAHSELLGIYIAFGITGLIIFGYTLLETIKINNKDPLIFSCFMAFIINSLANFPGHISSLALVVMMSFGMLQNKENEMMQDIN